jgi:hypothetical protein
MDFVEEAEEEVAEEVVGMEEAEVVVMEVVEEAVTEDGVEEDGVEEDTEVAGAAFPIVVGAGMDGPSMVGLIMIADTNLAPLDFFR